MTRLEWGQEQIPFELGVGQGVLYLESGAVPWNGLVSIAEDAPGDVDTTHYFDGLRTHITQEIGDYTASLKAYTYPDAFAEYNGYSPEETYRRFGLCYRTEHGDGYQLHLVYNALLRPQARTWSTVTNSPSASLFEWDISGEPTPIAGARPTAHMILDSRELDYIVRVVERSLYGTDTTEPRLPTPDEIVAIYEEASKLKITYFADGSYTAEGDEELVQVFPDGTFQINSPTAQLLDPGTFQVSSY